MTIVKEYNKLKKKYPSEPLSLSAEPLNNTFVIGSIYGGTSVQELLDQICKFFQCSQQEALLKNLSFDEECVYCEYVETEEAFKSRRQKETEQHNTWVQECLAIDKFNENLMQELQKKKQLNDEKYKDPEYIEYLKQQAKIQKKYGKIP